MKLLEVYEGTNSVPSVASGIFQKCMQVAESFPDTKIVFIKGPFKSSKRSMEKSLCYRGQFDMIHDYSRGMFVMHVSNTPISNLSLLAFREDVLLPWTRCRIVFKLASNPCYSMVLSLCACVCVYSMCVMTLFRCYFRNWLLLGQDLTLAPKLITTLIRASDTWTIIRTKNRFAVGHDAKLSAGYRDFQLLVRSKDGWIVELQLIPAQTLEVKSQFGHSEYTEFRFILECARRARNHDLNQRGVYRSVHAVNAWIVHPYCCIHSHIVTTIIDVCCPPFLSLWQLR